MTALHVPITDEQIESDPYNVPTPPGMEDDRIAYMVDRRKKLGGGLPSRRVAHAPLVQPRTMRTSRDPQVG